MNYLSVPLGFSLASALTIIIMLIVSIVITRRLSKKVKLRDKLLPLVI